MKYPCQPDRVEPLRMECGHAQLLPRARHCHSGLQPADPRPRLGDEKLAAVAAAYDRMPAQVLLGWNLQLGVAPLPKANREEHLKENLGAFHFERSEGPLTALQDFNEHYSSLGSLQYV